MIKIKTCYTVANPKFSLKDSNAEFSAIRMRVFINKVRLNIHLPAEYEIKPCHWDNATGRAIEDPKRNPNLKGNPLLQVQLRNINKEIERTLNLFIWVMENFKLHNIQPMADQVKAEMMKELNRVQVETKRTFTDFISYIDFFITLCREGSILNDKGAKLVPGSIRNYVSTQSALKRYSKDRNVKLTLESINMDFYNDFVSYLNETKHSRGLYRPSVIGKFIKNIKVFMRYANENGYTINDDFKKKDFKAFREDAESIYLNESELEKLYTLELPDNQAQVRDGFLISCYTGLRYSDIARLAAKHINFQEETITIVTQKTATKVVIPIHPVVKIILEKYGNKPPVIQCNQATNRMLKKICRKAGITEKINIMETKGGIRQEVTYEKCEMVTSHTARRSFASNASKKGIPSLAIMQITGHKTESSFMRYVRITKEENAKMLLNHDFFRSTI